MRLSTRKKIVIGATGILVILASLGFRSDYLEIAKQLDIFTTLFKEVHMNYVDQTDPADLMENAIQGILSDLDPYTQFWNEQDVENSEITISGQYTGIGATVNILNDKIIIVEAYKNHPADKAGLKAADEITEIDGIRLSDFTENPGELLQGSPDSKINLKFKRQGQEHSTVLTREFVEIKAVPHYSLLEDNIGYMVLSQFNQHITEETIAALEDLQKQGAKKIILDLRNNPGGLLSEAISVANIFLPEGELVTSTKSAIEKYNQDFYTTRKPINTEIPLVVLINQNTASASEIVAGAFQDLDRAVVIGTRSFGKGFVQRPRDLSYGTQLKITISRYYTPSGRGIQTTYYNNQDVESRTARMDTEDYKEFKTRNGRSVFEGGGIMPDIELATSNLSEVTSALLFQDIIFDFATQYYYSHELSTYEDFEFTDTDYQRFKKFLEKREFTYQTFTERRLAEAFLVAEHEGLDSVISEGYHQLHTDITAAKKQQLDKNQAEISNLLSEEIIKRFFYKEGLFDYQVKHNLDIRKAREVLANDSLMKKILSRGV